MRLPRAGPPGPLHADARGRRVGRPRAGVRGARRQHAAVQAGHVGAGAAHVLGALRAALGPLCLQKFRFLANFQLSASGVFHGTLKSSDFLINIQ